MYSQRLNRAAQLFAAGEYVAASQLYDQLTHEPNATGDAWFGQGCTLQALGQVEPAEAAYRQAILLGTPSIASVWFNLGNLLRGIGRYPEADSAYRFALAFRPDHAGARFGLAKTDLVQGAWVRGWANYESRWQGVIMSPSERARRANLLAAGPEWLGEPLAGKRLLVYPEQGAGDTFQFLRFLPLLRSRGAQVVLSAEPNSRSLLVASQLCGANELAGGQIRITGHTPLMSLPHRLGIDDERGLHSPPYLFAPADAQARWSAQLADAPGLKVGLVWAGNPEHANDANRSMPLAVLTQLLHCPNVTWVSLQKPTPAADMQALADSPQIRRYGEQLGDYGDTAGLMANLDLVIGVDTSVVHLAGAMGKPVWIMLTKVPEWRWQLARQDSPWYPSARLFRQTSAGDWGELLQRVGQALAGLSSAGAPALNPPR